MGFLSCLGLDLRAVLSRMAISDPDKTGNLSRRAVCLRYTQKTQAVPPGVISEEGRAKLNNANLTGARRGLDDPCQAVRTGADGRRS